MAALVYYWLDSAAPSGGAHRATSVNAPTAFTAATGWTVGTTATGNYAKMAGGVKRLASTFSTTVQPINGGPDSSLGDCFVVGPLKGTFAAGAWSLYVSVIAVTLGGSQDGNPRVRLWRSASPLGTSATELGVATAGPVVTNVTTAAAQSSTFNTASMGPFTFDNEYLLVELAWQITGAGAGATCDLLLRHGSGLGGIVTPAFSPAMTASPGTLRTGKRTIELSATPTGTPGANYSYDYASLPLPNVTYTFQTGDYLEYDVQWDQSGARFAMDLLTTDNSFLAIAAATVDQYGFPGSNYLAAGAIPDAYVLNRWMHRRILLPSAWAGKVFNCLLPCMEARDSGNQPTGTYTGRIANVLITNGAGTVRKVLFRGDAPAYTFVTYSDVGCTMATTDSGPLTTAQSQQEANLNVVRVLGAAPGAFVEAGVAAAFARTYRTTAALGTFTEAGIAAALKVGRRVTSALGTFTETGNAAALTVGHRTTAALGAFVEAGIAAGLRTTRVLTSAPGAFVEAGIAASLRATRLVGASVGAFVEAGKTAATLAGRRVTSSVGAFVEAGIVATLTKTTPAASVLGAAPGAFVETGNAAGLTATRRVVAAIGTFAETGIAAALNKGRRLAVDVGAFVETGTAAGLFVGRRFVAAVGTFVETSVGAALTRGRSLVSAVGTFTRTGNAAALVAARRVSAAAGALVWGGVAAGLQRARTLAAALGLFVETGNAAGLVKPERLTAAPGAFVVTGSAATLTGTVAHPPEPLHVALAVDRPASPVALDTLGVVVSPDATPIALDTLGVRFTTEAITGG